LADESYPEDLRYHPEHDWARIDGAVATFGITWYAQDALGEVVFFDPPEPGADLRANSPYADIDSTKASSEVYAPLSGKVTEVNAKIEDSPELVNEDPYGEGWLVKVELSDPGEVEKLMDAAAYKKLLSEEAD
jgi:glycine cleavage system H protein